MIIERQRGRAAPRTPSFGVAPAAPYYISTSREPTSVSPWWPMCLSKDRKSSGGVYILMDNASMWCVHRAPYKQLAGGGTSPVPAPTGAKFPRSTQGIRALSWTLRLTRAL